MQTDLMSGIPHLRHLLRKRLDCVGGTKEACTDVVTSKEGKKPIKTYGGAAAIVLGTNLYH